MDITRRNFIVQIGFTSLYMGFNPSFSTDFLSKKSQSLPRSTPEAQGVDAPKILDFIEAINKSSHEFHSFMLMRNGYVVAEGWWSPYRPDLRHTMYSMSKSFTSTAVGFAVSEGELNVTDKIITFFPNELPETVSPYLAQMTIKDLLTMSVGHETDTTGQVRSEENWVKKFLSLPIKYEPGTQFLYNSAATYMCSAIVQKVTGQKIIDYLKPRLFDPLGIEGMDWESCPRGINIGGWGLRVKTEDLAKFGQLYLQKGLWKGKQVVPAAWVEEATTFKIQQPGEQRDTNDWQQGYCYQFWRCRHNAYRGDGAFGQYTIVMPDQNAVLAITSESPNMGHQLNLIWEHILPALTPSKSISSSKSQQLRTKTAALALPLQNGNLQTNLVNKISGKTFQLENNEMNIKNITLRFNKNGCRIKMEGKKETYEINSGLGKWKSGETTFPYNSLNISPPSSFSGLINKKTEVAGAWKNETTFEMIWRYIESPHHDVVTCEFEENNIKITFLNSLAKINANNKDARPVLRGKMI
ncbi:MAG: serine hydrolase [Saprospiraceae bacterium]|nr:serine hydrolase [Saprospiraceae bacterium]